jgi:hypothetical protein
MSEYEKTAKDYGLKEGDKIICLTKESDKFDYKEIITFYVDDDSSCPWFMKEDASNNWSFALSEWTWSKIDVVNQEDNTELKAYDELIRIQKDIEEAIKRIKPVEE